MGYKLSYFNFRGFGEVIRLIFEVAGVDYEDNRIKLDDWPNIKACMATPMGQLPVLEFDGKVLCQSAAICDFLGRKYDLAGKDPLDAATCNMIHGCMTDLVHDMYFIAKETDEAKKATMRKATEEKLPTKLAHMEKLASDTGHFVGNELTWADLTFMHHLDVPKNVGIEIDFSKYPKMTKTYETAKSNPKVAAWLKRRPVTSM